MILVGAFLRHNEYEDYDIKLPKHIFQFLPMVPDTFNLYRLNAFFKNHKGIYLTLLFIDYKKPPKNIRL